MTAEVAELRAIRADYPDWELGFDANAGCWTAVSHPTQTAEHFIAARTLERLREKLEAAR